MATLAITLLSLPLLTSSLPLLDTLTCTTQSSPNPIAPKYPNLTTGTINGTVAILPIPYAQARAIIPPQYPILTQQYASWLKDTEWTADMYPAVLQAELDHDVQNSGVRIPDFSRAGVSFPFVDRLGDGYTAMSYSRDIIISASNPVAVVGAAGYGNTVTPGTFSPRCDAYACFGGDGCDQRYFDATPVLSRRAGIAMVFDRPLPGFSPYSLDFYKNITNQPQFSDSLLPICDNYIRLFNSSVTGDPSSIGTVKGRVTVREPFIVGERTWEGVYGIQVDNAFVENNFMTCESLRGYQGTGGGD